MSAFFRRLVGLLAAVICLVAIAVSACGGDSSPSQRGDFLVGYRLHLEAVLAARAVVVATSNQKLAAYNSAPTRPLTASDLVVDEVDSLLNRVRRELPVPPDEPLRSLDAAWRSGIVRWSRAEQALASEDSQKNRDAEQQAMDEEHGAVQALTKYATGSITAPPTTTSIAAAPTTTKTDTLKVDEAKFTAVWRALMKIEGATSVGVVYNDMRSLVQDFATQISLLSQDMNDDERLAALGLLNIAQAYNDSLSLWKAQIDFGKSDSYEGAGLIPYATAEASWVSKYGLSFVTGDKTKLTPDSIERVWSWAYDKTDELRPILAP